eukprot:UN21133
MRQAHPYLGSEKHLCKKFKTPVVLAWFQTNVVPSQIVYELDSSSNTQMFHNTLDREQFRYGVDTMNQDDSNQQHVKNRGYILDQFECMSFSNSTIEQHETSLVHSIVQSNNESLTCLREATMQLISFQFNSNGLLEIG